VATKIPALWADQQLEKVVVGIKNDWAQLNPKWFKTRINLPCLPGARGAEIQQQILHGFKN
jgi:hypothetical protein